MTENYIWFAVLSDKPPKESNALYAIEPFKPPKALREMCGVPEVKWYRGKTYFRQVEALAELGKQYKNELMFFAFTGWDSDFSWLMFAKVIFQILLLTLSLNELRG